MAKEATAITTVLRQTLGSGKQEQIAALAFEYWLARGFRDGSPETDWLRAERALREGAGTQRLFLVPPRRRPASSQTRHDESCNIQEHHGLD